MRYGLIISGDKGVVETLSLLLGEMENVRVVKAAREGMKEILQQPADFAILDSCVKDMAPVAVLGKLMRIQETLPVIVLVPSIHAAVVGDLKEAGAYAVMEKPFDREEILNVVERAIEKRRLMSEVTFLRTGGGQPAGASAAPGPAESQYFYREVLRRFSKAISQVFDHKKLLDLAVEAIVETFNTGKALILLLNRKSGNYEPISFIGYKEEILLSLFLDPTDDLPVWLSRHNQILCAGELSGPLRFTLYQQASALGAEIITGLFAKGKLIGILAMGKKVTGKDYSGDDLELLSIVTNYLAMAIENALLYRDIEKNRAHNEKVLDHLKTGVVTIDSRGMITTFNRAAEEILELKHEDVMGEKIERLGSQFADILLRTMAGEGEYRRHEIIFPPSKKPLEISASTMLDGDGSIYGAIVAFADLSRIKKLEEKERDLERLEFWSKMAGCLAHEVKNPLVPIKTFAQLLPQRYGDKHFREEFSQVVNAEIDRLNSIIGQLTKFAESPRPRKRPIDIHGVIEQAMMPLSTKIGEKNARVVRKFSEEELVMEADGVLLSEAFVNILDNAIDAVAENGTITISTGRCGRPSRTDGSAQIVFLDNGRGIGKDELPGIFTPFITTKTKGMGLGLAIAQRIIKDHQGTIEVTSSRGKGSSVKVVLPLEKA